MDAVEDLIYAAWKQVRPRLEAEPALLAERIARRRLAVLARPPRAWCLAVRASDRRIASGCDQPVEHQVKLTAPLLRRVCAPVHLTPPGERLEEVAAKLGTTPMGLRWARLTGVFRTHHVEGLGGTGRKPIPLIYTDKPLDPCARRRGEADELWGWTSGFLTKRIADDFAATLTRVPGFGSHVSRHAYDDTRHPELDGAPAPKRLPRLPPPPPDYVWYKWSRTGDYFLGDDPSNWRKGPEDFGDRPPKWLPKRKRNRKPRPSRSGGSLHFRGFAWICPACGKTCRTVYLPMPPINLLSRVEPRIAQCVEVMRKIEGFACARCHHVRFFSSIHHGCWNQLIAYLTAGLLYGHEVPRPAWFVPRRKEKFVPRVNAPPSRRRPAVMEMVLKGMSSKEIAAELGIAPATVHRHTVMLYAQQGVRGREALARKLGREFPARWETKLERIRQRLGAGWTYDEVGVEMGMTRHRVAEYASVLRRKGIAVAYQGKASWQGGRIARAREAVT